MTDFDARDARDAYVSCWCCGQHGLGVPADSQDGLCVTCRGRSPSACQRAHKRDVAARAAMAAGVRAKTEDPA
jgi:hypothetical protein